MTFEKWLSQQIDRNDPVGDLAKDFQQAKKPYEKCDEAHLLKWNAIEGAFSALKRARREYLKR